MVFCLEYEKERGGPTVSRFYEDKLSAIAAAKDRALYRATVWEVDGAQRRFIMRRFKGV